jgi:hypothetical protein
MCSIRLVIALSLVSVFASHAQAQTNKAHRIMAETVDLAGKDTNNVQLQIWADRLPSLVAARQSLQKAVPSLKLEAEFFTTSFKDGDSSIIISVLNDQCSSTEGQPNDLFCPARVVEETNGKLHLLSEVDDFDIHMVRGEAGYDDTSNRSATDMTVATFDPAMKKLVVTVVDGGQSQDPSTLSLK